MATGQSGTKGRPIRMGWSVGLLAAAAVVFASTFLPAILVWSVGGGQGVSGTAMFGGFVAGWFSHLGAIHLGVRRGWWA